MLDGLELNANLKQATPAEPEGMDTSPFLLQNEGEYQAWRNRKLELRARLDPGRIFRLDSECRLREEDRERVRRQVDAFNFVLVEADADMGKTEFLALNRQFGLIRLDSNPGADADSVTSLHVVASNDERAAYIPYTNRALNWHTDGYYNPQPRCISAFALYCVNQAGRGGGNFLFDHEMMYLLVRDRAPDLLAALMAPDMMRVPPNIQGNRILRGEESGPVFSVHPQNRRLHMRYTSRPRNILWKSDKRSERALNLVREILVDGDTMVEVRLANRQGLICNNILHGREAFHDAAQHPSRLIYRARYHDSIDLERGREAGA